MRRGLFPSDPESEILRMLERKVHAAFWFHEPWELAVLQSRLATRRRSDRARDEARI